MEFGRRKNILATRKLDPIELVRLRQMIDGVEAGRSEDLTNLRDFMARKGITEEELKRYLWSADLPAKDLIRGVGVKRK